MKPDRIRRLANYVARNKKAARSRKRMQQANSQIAKAPQSTSARPRVSISGAILGDTGGRK